MTGDAFAALWEIGTRIQAEETDHEAVLRLIVEHARTLLASDVAWLALVDDDGRHLRIRVADGARGEHFMDQAVTVGTGIGGVALLRGTTVVVPDYVSHIQDTPDTVRAAMLEEDIVTVLCGPMLRADRMIGALYVGNRRATDFAEPAPSLMSALAAQAAVAVANAGLYRRLAEQNRLLSETWSIHRRLTDVALSGGGVDAVGRTLAGLVGTEVVVEQDLAPPFRTLHGTPAGDDAEETTFRVAAGEAALGRLHLRSRGPLDDLQRTAAEQAATVLALELLRLRESRETEWRVRGELLDELLDAGSRDPRTPGLLSRARLLGVDLDVPVRLLAVTTAGEADRPALLEAVRLAVAGLPSGSGLPVALRGDVVALAVPTTGAPAAGDVALAVRSSAQRRGLPVRIGVSSALPEAATAWREAEACLRLARRDRAAGAIVRHEDLGALRFLLDAPDLSVVEAGVREQLGPLAEWDRTRGGSLLDTVRAYVRADGHQGATAAALFLHVSTVKYRLSRAAAVLGRPLGDPQHRFELRLALELLDVLRNLGGDPLEETGDPR